MIGATNATLTISPTALTNSGSYKVVVTNSFNTANANAFLNVITTCGPLSARLSAGQVILEWPGSSACTLEFEDALTGEWIDIPGPYPLISGTYTVTINPTAAAKFYRLHL
jgi:hypothetical protein